MQISYTAGYNVCMVKEITFVTGNLTKVLHANEVLEKFGYTAVAKKLDIIEPREEDPAIVATDKALQAFKVLQSPLMVEDSGIFIRALNGFPKTFVHFVEDTIGISNILKMMEGNTDRSAEFRQSLAYMAPAMKEPMVFSYVDGGYILADKIWTPKYDDAGEFDKILIPPGETQPLCMFSKEWRAKRDEQANQAMIHYRQLLLWLGSGPHQV